MKFAAGVVLEDVRVAQIGAQCVDVNTQYLPAVFQGAIDSCPAGKRDSLRLIRHSRGSATYLCRTCVEGSRLQFIVRGTFMSRKCELLMVLGKL